VDERSVTIGAVDGRAEEIDVRAALGIGRRGRFSYRSGRRDDARVARACKARARIPETDGRT